MLYPSYYAKLTPHKVAYKMCATGEEVSFEQLEQKSNQGAHALRRLGARSGDHIIILMENRREFLEICFSADRSGLYYTTISTYLTVEEIIYIIRDCNAKVIITSGSFSSIAKEIREKVGPEPNYLIVDGELEGYQSWEKLCAGQPVHPIEDELQGLDMLYSSGTTGTPKGVKWKLTGENPGKRTMLIGLLCGLFGYDHNTRYLCPAPLYHAAPLRHSMTTIKVGGTVFVMDRFDAQKSLEIIEHEKITHAQWVPTMFIRMLKLPENVYRKYDVSSLKVAVHAAAPCPMDVKEEMIKWWGPIIHEYYAGTENNGFCAIDTQQWMRHKGSVGKAILGKVRICDDSGKELPCGEEGEVYFSNGHDFSYHNDPAKTKACRNKEGWTTIGDIGMVDTDGYLYLTDRKSFVIISGGVNIYPQEIENAILAHPKVADVAVIGVPNDDFGEEVKAIVQPIDMSMAGNNFAEELIEFCKKRISKIKCPRSVDFMEKLPRQPTGKLFKRILKEKYWSEYKRTQTKFCRTNPSMKEIKDM
jgi:fatty-acyl-CoA synthase